MRNISTFSQKKDRESFLDLLLSAAPVESHVGAVVDSPNACVTLAVPIGIFDFVSNRSSDR